MYNNSKRLKTPHVDTQPPQETRPPVYVFKRVAALGLTFPPVSVAALTCPGAPKKKTPFNVLPGVQLALARRRLVLGMPIGAANSICIKETGLNLVDRLKRVTKSPVVPRVVAVVPRRRDIVSIPQPSVPSVSTRPTRPSWAKEPYKPHNALGVAPKSILVHKTPISTRPSWAKDPYNPHHTLGVVPKSILRKRH
jgi:hypothetical protein